jgi:zinc protease
MNLEQAHHSIEKYMNPDKMVYLVVGDAETQLPRLKELGLGEPIVLDRDGNSVAPH